MNRRVVLVGRQRAARPRGRSRRRRHARARVFTEHGVLRSAEQSFCCASAPCDSTMGMKCSPAALLGPGPQARAKVAVSWRGIAHGAKHGADAAAPGRRRTGLAGQQHAALAGSEPNMPLPRRGRGSGIFGESGSSRCSKSLRHNAESPLCAGVEGTCGGRPVAAVSTPSTIRFHRCRGGLLGDGAPTSTPRLQQRTWTRASPRYHMPCGRGRQLLGSLCPDAVGRRWCRCHPVRWHVDGRGGESVSSSVGDRAESPWSERGGRDIWRRPAPRVAQSLAR